LTQRGDGGFAGSPVLLTSFARDSMSILPPLMLVVFVLGCANNGDESGADASPTNSGVAVDPCALLTKEQIAAELLLSVSPSQRAEWTTTEFTVANSPVTRGESLSCEYTFSSHHLVGGTPASQSAFNVVVSPANLVLVPQDQRVPVPGVPGMFGQKSAEGVYYVLKGDHAATISNFPMRSEGDANAGRIALLRHIAARLP
jgi:hypothetical protein